MRLPLILTLLFQIMRCGRPRCSKGYSSKIYRWCWKINTFLWV